MKIIALVSYKRDYNRKVASASTTTTAATTNNSIKTNYTYKYTHRNKPV